MRYIFSLIFLLLFQYSYANPDFVSAEIRVDGLTCSLCSKSVEKALKKLHFVEEVEMNLETTFAEVHFRRGVPVNISEIAKAVNNAGFSIGMLRINAQGDGLSLNDCQAFVYNSQIFQFYGDKSPEQSGRTLSFEVLGKDFLTISDFSQIKNILPQKCNQKNLSHFYVRN